MTDNHASLLGEIKADIAWIKKALESGDTKYASKWVEKAVYLGMTGIGVWVINQILSLIPKVQAFF